MTDFELLQRYAITGSDTAFEVVVKRYANLVHSAALRQSGNPDVAEEITQTVFIILARKAGAIHRNVILSGWLLRTTRFVALNARRNDWHRRERELEAAGQYASQDTKDSEEAWTKISPIIDEAMVRLSEADRNALVLRFFEQKSLKEIGEIIGTSEDGAQKRVSRALVRLRTHLLKAGVTLSSATLAMVVGTRTVQAAPAALIDRLARRVAVSGGGGATVTSLAKVTLSTLAAERFRSLCLKTGAVVLAIMLALPGLWKLRQSESSNGNSAQKTPDGAIPSASVSGIQAGAIAGALSPMANSEQMSFRILDAKTGEPLGGVRVSLFRDNEFPGRARMVVTSGADGKCRLPIDSSLKELWDYRIEIFKDGYVPKYVSWSYSQGDAFEEIPMEYTARMTRGVQIGGRVINENGEGISQARVIFDVVGMSPATSGERERLTMGGNYHAEVTDTSGEWRCTHVPSQFGNILFRVVHPDYRTAVFGSAALGVATNFGTVYLTEEEFRNAKAMMVLKRGIVLEGTVVDEEGWPVAGAKLTENRDWSEPTVNQVSKADGYFRFGNAPETNLLLTVQAKDFAPSEVMIDPASQLNMLRVRVTKGGILHGKVLNKNSGPITNATICIKPDDLNRDRFEWSTTTDATGAFEWRSAPLTKESYCIYATGYRPLEDVELASEDGAEHRVIMEETQNFKQFRISGTVVDAESREAVETFQVVVGKKLRAGGPLGAQLAMTLVATPEATGAWGRFSIRADASVLEYELEIRADGYLPARKTVVGPITNDFHMRFELTRTHAITGRVLLPSGEPADGATVALCGTRESGTDGVQGWPEGVYIMLPGTINLFRSDRHTETDSEGRFALQSKLEMREVIAAHKKGFARVSIEQLKSGHEMKLEPWGRVEGKVKGANGFNTKQSLYLSNIRRHYSEPELLQIHLEAAPDGQGRFTIEGVPPGEWKCYPEGTVVQVHSEETTQIELAGNGRNVFGKATVTRAGPEIVWQQVGGDLNSTNKFSVRPKRGGYSAESDYQVARREWADREREFWTSLTGREVERTQRQYDVRFRADGTFLIENVLPGTYDLLIEVGPTALARRSSSLNWMAWGIRKQIEVPAETEERKGEAVDLGILELTQP